MPRVQVIAPAHLGETAVTTLRARGIDARRSDVPGDAVIAWALEATPTATAAVELAATCARAAAEGRPVCLLAPPLRGSGRAAIERAAALAYLRAHGAALGHDVDAWLEAVVALCRFGMPKGPHTAVIAPEGSWLEAQAIALVAEAESAGTRAPLVGRTGKGEPTDVVLYDPSAPDRASAQLAVLQIPVVARGELGDGEQALYGLRAAIGAIEMLGHAAERIAVGLGPAPATASSELSIDSERMQRQLTKLVRYTRVGDHETKVLLSAYGVPITRQAVATTPSAAVKAARRAGYPVELKPYGDDLPTEPEGGPVEKMVTSDALVRRAFAAVLAAAGRLPTKAESGAVIVRETPPQGRDVSVKIVKLPAVGWTVVLDAPSAPQIAAAPAPLRLIDAQMLANAIGASRASDPDLDRTGLANLLRRASHLVVDLDDRIEKLELPRVVVAGRGSRTVVVDAWCELTFSGEPSAIGPAAPRVG
ncbi:MAG TPA: acetate--CoA ligase family protein [Kofleriaceae bacterium]